jgi:hypothetical protein
MSVTIFGGAPSASQLSRCGGIGSVGPSFLKLGQLSQHRLVLFSIGSCRFHATRQYVVSLRELVGLKIANDQGYFLMTDGKWVAKRKVEKA